MRQQNRALAGKQPVAPDQGALSLGHRKLFFENLPDQLPEEDAHLGLLGHGGSGDRLPPDLNDPSVTVALG